MTTDRAKLVSNYTVQASDVSVAHLNAIYVGHDTYKPPSVVKPWISPHYLAAMLDIELGYP